MREILFRGKRKDGLGWVRGNYIFRKIWKSDVHIIRTVDIGFDSYTEFEVIPETVGQYTGLTDENGRKIFEGDIVDYEDETPGQYEYHDSTFFNRGVIEYDAPVFYWTNLIAAQLEDCVYKGAVDCVIIGNIHDNPELLEV